MSPSLPPRAVRPEMPNPSPFRTAGRIAVQSSRPAALGLVLTVALALPLAPLAAIDVPEETPLPPRLAEALARVDFARYEVQPRPAEAGPPTLRPMSSTPGMAGFAAAAPGTWRVQMDARTGAPMLIEGAGIPMLPGSANTLAEPAFGELEKGRAATFTMADVAAVTGDFLTRNAGVLRVSPEDLMLDEKSSVGLGRRNRYWSLRYQAVMNDPELGPIPVRDAEVFFRINQGNLVQFGNEMAVAPRGIDTGGVLSKQQAMDAALALFDDPEAKAYEPVIDVGQQDRTLEIVPQNLAGDALGHQLVRSVLVETSDHSIELWFDAHSGDLVYALDRRLPIEGTVRGGVYPATNTDPEESRPLPFLRVTNGGVKVTDLGGGYDYAPPGSAASAALTGDFIAVDDRCGASSVSTSTSPGDLDFGRGGATDCSTPGLGGAGNTHSARSTYYHLNLIKEKARRYLNDPVVTTPWLEAQLTANVNIADTCNAFWSPGGGTVNFYRSGGGCSNTGELAAVFLHEFGHGLDQNTNGSPPENGSGEAYGDTLAFLQTHDSCIGDNFRPGRPCIFGCGGGCTGVRDVAVRPRVRPGNVTAAPADCDRFACPYTLPGGFPYQGPMGYEGHCESLIASGAVWDMVQAFVGRYGDGAGWALGDRIWYESLFLTGSAYQVVSGGKCNAGATVNGCGASNWYTVFSSLDDDNGNLADGTPNADLIWNAFNAHGIACGTSAPPVHSTCPALAAPALAAAAAGPGRIDLSWGPIAGAVSYRVFRNEFGCGQAFTPIADVTAPAAAFADTAVDPATTYHYAVQAVGASDVCVSQFSNCVDISQLPRLVLAPDRVKLDKVGATAALTATLTDGAGAVVPGVAVTFSSADPSVATVTPAGVTDAAGRANATVQAQKEGRTKVEATAAGAKDDAAVEVKKVPAASAWGLALAALLGLGVLRRTGRGREGVR